MSDWIGLVSSTPTSTSGIHFFSSSNFSRENKKKKKCNCNKRQISNNNKIMNNNDNNNNKSLHRKSMPEPYTFFMELLIPDLGNVEKEN